VQEEFLQDLEFWDESVEDGAEVDDTHAVDHLFHGLFESVAVVVLHLLLLDLNKAIAEGVEEVGLKVVRVVFADEFDDQGY